MPSPKESILVLGAYGLIGSGIARRLLAEGHDVIGLGRNARTAERVLPGIPCIARDMRGLCNEDDWRPILSDVSTVVNCSGALQDGPEDDLEAIHHHAIAALAKVCAAENIALIQISAVGASPDASTAFMATKGRGDAAIRQTGGKWHIFRPGLVLAKTAYGGTAMLRMLAAFPLIQPLATPEAKIQTVALDDVATAVVAAISDNIPAGFEGDLVEQEAHSLRNLVGRMRHWLGFRPARLTVNLPDWTVMAVSKVADALSHLGWRSPLRTTALTVLTEGVRGSPADMATYGMPAVTPLDQTLGGMEVGAQDRSFARMALLFPVVIICLSLFWLTSGIIGIARAQVAADVLQNVGWPTGLAVASVVFWGVVDIAIGVAFAIRKYAYAACWAAVGVSLFYLLASTVTVPALWLDPLGPLVKVIPGIVLALVARVALDAR